MQTTKINISIVEEDWMPFSCAPQDGRLVVVRDADGRADLCRWSRSRRRWMYEFGNVELPTEFTDLELSP